MPNKLHPPNLAHLMRRFVRGFSINVFQRFIQTVSQGQLPTCATRGAGALAQACTQAIPNTTINVRDDPKRPSWTSSLANAVHTRSFMECTVYQKRHHIAFYSLTKRCMCLQREFPCSIHTHANHISCIQHGVHASNSLPSRPINYGRVPR
jgi:hypothetical protein